MEKYIFVGVIIGDAVNPKCGKVLTFLCIAESKDEAIKQGKEMIETDFKPKFFKHRFHRVEVVVNRTKISDLQDLISRARVKLDRPKINFLGMEI